jgi:hypothetical protein
VSFGPPCTPARSSSLAFAICRARVAACSVFASCLTDDGRRLAEDVEHFDHNFFILVEVTVVARRKTLHHGEA